MAKTRQDLKILIVDDDEKSLKLLEAKLNILGFKRILKANNGDECMSLSQEELPDLIFLDIVMPGLDGGDIAKKLSEIEKTKDIPVIFATVLITSKEIGSSGSEIEGKIFIAKPYDTEKIEQAIRVALGDM
ncbi:unnamed protein product [marine sediment metagenome]|uniref:Response regulatory domain-containing protein n=1 Tax=marine sediment metagenome TaxID=412755 RepID=X1DRW1_9ZZZZ